MNQRNTQQKKHFVSPKLAFLFVSIVIAALCCACFCLPLNNAQAEPNESDQAQSAAASDAASSASNGKVRVAFFPLSGFYDYDGSSNMTGYGVEYFNALAEYSGIDYEYVPATSWVDAVEMFDEGSVDVLAPSEITAERSEKYRFCSLPIGTEYGSLLTLSTNDKLSYEDFSSFNGMKVGVVSSIVFMDRYLDYQKANEFTTQFVYYKDTQALTAALNAGEVDAIMANLMVKTSTMKVLAKFGAAPIYYMVRQDNPQLQVELNEALQSFASANPSFQTQLTEKYFSAFNETPLTKQEKAFASLSDVVTVGLAPDSAPLAHFEADGVACGVYVEYLNQIAETSGLKFDYVALPATGVDDAYLSEHNISIIAGMESSATGSQVEGVHLSKPFQTMAKVFVGDISVPYNFSGPLRVAVTDSITDSLATVAADHPNFQLIHYASTEECLAAVNNGEADVVLQNRYVVERLLSSPSYENLSVLPIEGISADYAFGEVDSVLNKAYGSVGANMFKSIINKSITQVPDETVSGILASEALENQYRLTLADVIYQYRVLLIVLALSLAAVIAALSFAVHIQSKNRRAIQDNEQKLSDITNNINGGVVVVNGDDTLLITYANDGFLDLIGCTREQFENEYDNSYLTFVHPEDAESLTETASMHAGKKGKRVSIPLRLRREDGTYLDTLFNGTFRVDSDGKKLLYCVVTDVSKQVSLLNELTLEKKRAELFFEKSDNVIYEVNLIDKTITASDNMLTMLGWTLPKKLQNITRDEFMFMWRTDEESKDKLLDASKLLLQDKVDVKTTIPLQTAAGGFIWCEIDQYPVLDKDGNLASIVGRILDVNTAVTEKQRLEEIARTDSMTGLLKKEYFVDQVRTYLSEGEPYNCALLFFDVDHFKEVNDTLGHEMGDECLKDVAQKLKVAFSSFDLIARFGGDEFVVFVKNIPHETLKDKLNWLQGRLQEDYCNGPNSLTVTCSIGAACTDDFGRQYDKLLGSADAALYEAKHRGRAQFVMSQPGSAFIHPGNRNDG